MRISSYGQKSLHPDGLQNLYVASYVHHIDDLDPAESQDLIDELLEHVSNAKYRVTIPWEEEGDMIIWDNTSVMHRATGGSYEGRFRRDMRRTTVKDMSTSRFWIEWRRGKLACRSSVKPCRLM